MEFTGFANPELISRNYLFNKNVRIMYYVSSFCNNFVCDAAGSIRRLVVCVSDVRLSKMAENKNPYGKRRVVGSVG